MNLVKLLFVLTILCAAVFANAEICHFVLVGDIDGNCEVNMGDLAIMAQSWLVNCDNTPEASQCIPLDLDGDGFDAIADCNDNDPSIHPFVIEIPDDGIDQDCDGSDFHPAGILITIPAGTFQMGDSFNESNSEERPVHPVTLSSFKMSKHEITNGQYAQFLNSAYPTQIKEVSGMIYAVSDTSNSYPYFSTSSAPTGDPDFGERSQIAFSADVFSVMKKPAEDGRDMSDDPVVVVSYYGAKAFCDYYGYRLPTEAEWEYAARGGLSGKRFPWGDTISHSQANYISYWEGGSPYFSYDVSLTEGYHPTWNDGIIPYTSPVGSIPASVNGYGLHDMAGNVWEWCADWYSSSYYSNSPGTNPTGPVAGSYRVLRGGSWYHYALSCRVARRSFSYYPYTHNHTIGFRVCLD